MTAPLISRVDTLIKLEYSRNGGILSCLLRQLALRSPGRAIAPMACRRQKRIASSSGSSTTLSCSLGSVREITAVAGSVWLML